ncbi:MAG TPA: MBL fold metallo-hydrolase [Thermomonas sp.]|jgi:ribonuclease BN (tRNA processing enzyme)|nr:MBL fold metallo-hydrolase [Thermomonas sp.]
MRVDRRGFLATLAASGLLAAAPRVVASGPESRLVVLGTAGGPTPKPNRFPAAYALVVDEDVYLVDAGNGVAQQLARAGIGINRVRHVFISHHHSDHDADAGAVALLAWATNPTSPVTIWGPPPMRAQMAAYREYARFDIDTRTADEGRPDFDAMTRVVEFNQEGLLLDDGTIKVRCARNLHPPIRESYALRFDTPGRSYVFSGDTTYSPAVVALAKGADVLVHEVMYLPALDALIASEPNASTLREHLLASHSTPEQVGRVATEAGVGTLVLSHFVPGGPMVADETWLAAVRPHFGGRIVVAHDLMTLP